MSEYCLGFIDNNCGFSIICDVKSGTTSEWEILANHITKRLRLVAGGKAGLEVYEEYYGNTIGGDNYWYKYGDFPIILLMKKIGNIYESTDGEYDREQDNPYYWNREEIKGFFVNKYEGGAWALGEPDVPDLIKRSLLCFEC